MPDQALLALLVAAVLANTVLMAAVILRVIIRNRRDASEWQGFEELEATQPALERAEVERVPEDRDLLGLLDQARMSFDRVVRIVAWALILTVSVAVAVTGLWPQTQVGIYLLLAAAGIFVLVIHEIAPAGSGGARRHAIEGFFGLGFVGALVYLTGGHASPFFFTFPIVVTGIALVASPVVTAGLAILACLYYLAAIFIIPGGLGIPTGIYQVSTDLLTDAQIGIQVVGMLLLAFIASTVAGQQRRTRDAAILASTTDSLTGLANRGFLVSQIDREITRSQRTRRGFCLLLMDLDGLKGINDRFGHHHGDRILRGVASVIRTTIRRSDTGARHGGDEFAVLLPETEIQGGAILAEKIREGVARLTIESAGWRLAASVSVGVVSYPEDGRTVEELMMAGDRAMYGAKRRGKNQVVTVGLKPNPNPNPNDPGTGTPGGGATPPGAGAVSTGAGADGDGTRASFAGPLHLGGEADAAPELRHHPYPPYLAVVEDPEAGAR